MASNLDDCGLTPERELQMRLRGGFANALSRLPRVGALVTKVAIYVIDYVLLLVLPRSVTPTTGNQNPRSKLSPSACTVR
jgi:hypothetical protein